MFKKENMTRSTPVSQAIVERAKALVFEWRELQASPGKFPFLHKMIEQAFIEVRNEALESAIFQVRKVYYGEKKEPAFSDYQKAILRLRTEKECHCSLSSPYVCKECHENAGIEQQNED